VPAQPVRPAEGSATSPAPGSGGAVATPVR
jgi:hypothetical protein